jgi:hypothetical protein
MSSNPVGPSEPSRPQGSQPPPPISGQPASTESPFRKMFGGYMTDQEFKQFLNEFLKQMISQFKQADAGWKQAMDDMKKAIEGED